MLATEAWLDARSWLDAGAAPMQSRPVPAARIVSVSIRRDGTLIGTGESASHPGSGAPADLTEAMRQALAMARRDATFARAIEGDPSSWSRATLELELASEPEPLVGISYDQAARQVDPGIDGLAARRGIKWAHMMPGRLMSLEVASDPARSLVGLASGLGVPMRDLPDLMPAELPALYRVPVLRLVQPLDSRSPVPVMRLAPLVVITPDDGPDAGALACARDVASWLGSQLHPRPDASDASDAGAALESLGLRGDWIPAAGVHEPMAALPADQALAALALARFARASADEPSRTARDAAARTLAALVRVAAVERDPLEDRNAVSLGVLAALELSASGALPPDCIQARDALTTAFLRTGTPEGWLTKDSPTRTRSLELAAAAALRASGDARIDGVALRAALDAAWREIPRRDLVSELAWLLWAERLMRTSKSPPSADAAAHAEVARSTRAALSRAQIAYSQSTEADSARPEPADLVGGFRLAGPSTRGATAQGARPTLGLAMMLDDASCTPAGERYRAREMQRMAIRFLRQLQVEEAAASSIPGSRRCLGAIRSAPWEMRLSVAANATALLALVESHEGLISLERVLDSGVPAASTASPATP